MCGISGVLRREGVRGSGASLDDLRQRHRGPDDCGTYTDPEGRATLWFRRLSILDLSSAGHQPMSNEDGSVWVVFNGEIYNFAELRSHLESRGHRFRSRTDTEVLVHLWEEYGRDMLQRLNGMFALCVWDERTGEALLARDHAGIKPLYIAEVPEGLAFASEPKVLLSHADVNRSVDPVALQQYLTFLWVPGGRTMWNGVRKLLPGEWLSWRAGHVERGEWWDWDQSTQEERSPEEWALAVREALLDSVQRQMVSDVPIGALLSGGLDSSAIVGAMRTLREGDPIRCYTAAVDTGEDGFADDLPYARAVAERLRVELVEERIAPVISTLLPHLVWFTDEPLADPALAASYLLCRRARADGTVVLLSGQGADELYHGYRSHRAVRLGQRLSGVPSPMVRMATALGEALAGRTGMSANASPRRALKMLRYVGASGGDRILQLADWGSHDMRTELLHPGIAATPREVVYGDYLALFDRSRAPTDEERWSYVLFKTFLPALNLTYGDRTSMATSVELRVPFLDRALVEQAGRIPAALKHHGGRAKWPLAEAARPWLPPEILTRPKTGFGAPLRSWLQGELAQPMRDLLLGERFLARGLFRRQGVETLLGDLQSGRRDVAYIVWALFTFELWARTYSDTAGSEPIPLVA